MTATTYRVYLCGDDDPSPDDTSDCPQRDQHTPAPKGYVAWHEWAARMNYYGWRQRKCPDCGLYTIWSGGRPLPEKGANRG